MSTHRCAVALSDAHRSRCRGSAWAARDDRIARHRRQDLREHGEVGQPVRAGQSAFLKLALFVGGWSVIPGCLRIKYLDSPASTCPIVLIPLDAEICCSYTGADIGKERVCGA